MRRRFAVRDLLDGHAVGLRSRDRSLDDAGDPYCGNRNTFVPRCDRRDSRCLCPTGRTAVADSVADNARAGHQTDLSGREQRVRQPAAPPRDSRAIARDRNPGRQRLHLSLPLQTEPGMVLSRLLAGRAPGHGDADDDRLWRDHPPRHLPELFHVPAGPQVAAQQPRPAQSDRHRRSPLPSRHYPFGADHLLFDPLPGRGADRLPGEAGRFRARRLWRHQTRAAGRVGRTRIHGCDDGAGIGSLGWRTALLRPHLASGRCQRLCRNASLIHRCRDHEPRRRLLRRTERRRSAYA